MFEEFYKYITSKVSMSLEEFERVKQYFTPCSLERKQYLLRAGGIARHGSFVVSGCLRLYRVDANGVEHTQEFALENWWLSDSDGMQSGKPSDYSIEALEDCQLLLFTQAGFNALRDQSPAFDKLIRINHDNNLVATQRRLASALTYTAAQRYDMFLNAYPGIFQRVPQQLIASYLGITRETLSRIRKKKGKTGI